MYIWASSSSSLACVCVGWWMLYHGTRALNVWVCVDVRATTQGEIKCVLLFNYVIVAADTFSLLDSSSSSSSKSEYLHSVWPFTIQRGCSITPPPLIAIQWYLANIFCFHEMKYDIIPFFFKSGNSKRSSAFTIPTIMGLCLHVMQSNTLSSCALKENSLPRQKPTTKKYWSN